MKTISRLTIVGNDHKPQPPLDRPEPEHAHRLLQAFWSIRDQSVRARLLRDAETAAKSDH